MTKPRRGSVEVDRRPAYCTVKTYVACTMRVVASLSKICAIARARVTQPHISHHMPCPSSVRHTLSSHTQRACAQTQRLHLPTGAHTATRIAVSQATAAKLYLSWMTSHWKSARSSPPAESTTESLCEKPQFVTCDECPEYGLWSEYSVGGSERSSGGTAGAAIFFSSARRGARVRAGTGPESSAVGQHPVNQTPIFGGDTTYFPRRSCLFRHAAAVALT